MKLLLVSAVDPNKESETREPSLGLGYIAACLRQALRSLEIEIVDRDVDNALQRFGPDLVGVSCVSQNFGLATAIGERCREHGIPVFIGGVHISALPASLPRCMDFGVIGEGERTAVEVLRRFDAGRLDLRELQGIRGLVLRAPSGRISVTEPRTLIEPLDSLPLPARDLLSIKRTSRIHLFSSRGCPYACRFCFSSRFWQKVRFFSPRYVLRELEHVIDVYSPAQIAFWDDLFIADRQRLKEIVDLLEAQRITDKVEFYLTARANLVTPEVVHLLKRLNVAMVSMGLESGCQNTLSYLKGRITVEENRAAIELLKAAGIYVNATFIIGSPDEKEEEILRTLDFIRHSNLDTFTVYALTPYPGTAIWEDALAKGLVSEQDMDWSSLAIDWDDKRGQKLVLSERVSRERLFELYQLFQAERRKRRILYGLSRGLRQPRFAIRAIQARMPHPSGR
jgi:anaerobic magnesium-protoporphyrin IX monomethyl ester cyclase